MRESIISWLRRYSPLADYLPNRNRLLTLLDQTLISVTNFVSGFLLARWCPQGEYGFYVLALSLILIWDVARESLVTAPLTIYWCRRSSVEQPAYVGSALVILVMILIAALSLTSILAFILAMRGEVILSRAVWAVTFPMAGYIFREFIRKVFYIQLRVSVAFYVGLVFGLMQASMLGFLWSTGRFTALNALVAYGISQATAVLVGLFLLKGHISFFSMKLSNELHMHWRVGKWIFASLILMVGAFQILPWFLKLGWGEAAVGALGACMAIALAANPILFGSLNFMAPRMSMAFGRGGIAALASLVMRAQRLMGIVICGWALLIGIYAEDILWLLYGEKYGGYGGVLAFLAIGLVFIALYTPLSAALIVIERVKVQFYSAAACILFSLLVGYQIIINFGIAGAAVTIAGGRLLIFLLYESSYLFVDWKSRVR